MYGTPLGSNFIEDPVQGVVRFIPDSLAWLRGILGVWVGILAATILVIATNAGLIGVSRLAYSLGQHRQVPPILGRVHPTRLTPYVSIIVFGIVACLIILPGSTRLLADLYAFGAMISFTVAHISVVVLRFKEPELRRPFRTPVSIRIRGTVLARPVCHRRPGHLHRVVRRRRHSSRRAVHRLHVDGRRSRHVCRLPQGEGLFAHAHRRQGHRA